MSYEYSENVLVRDSSAKLLESMGWETVYAHNAEVLGKNGTLGRESYKDIVLTRYLRAALLENNDWLTDELCGEAIKTLLSYSSSAELIQINREKYDMLINGIPVSVRKTNGETETKLARVFRFDEPIENHFLAVIELKIHGDLYRRRTDIVGFVNGIPLLFIELKRQNVDVHNC